MRRRHIVAALLAGVSLAARAQPVEQITWLSGYRTSGAEAEMAEKQRRFIEAGWPQPRYTTIQANARRAWQLIEQGERVCQPSSVRTPEREHIAYFTDTLLGPPLQLIVRRDTLAAVPRNAAGEAELAALLAQAKLRGALVDGRSYGTALDATLAASSASSATALSRFSSSDFGSQIHAMLALGRADWSIGYDAELATQQREDPRLTALVSLPIAGATEMVRAGIACPRNAWGLAAIRGIDRVLATPAGAALLKQQALFWLTPEARQRYAGQLDEFYRARARPANIR